MSAEFKTIATWSEHLALGIDVWFYDNVAIAHRLILLSQAGIDETPASIVQPTLLRAVVRLKSVIMAKANAKYSR